MSEPSADAIGAAVAALADAFFDDPVVGFVFPDPAARAAQLPVWWRYFLDHRDLDGEVLVANGGQAAAVWASPVPRRGPEGDVVAMLSALIGADTALARLRALAVVGEAHPSEPHWYLLAVGTWRDAQGRGLGRTVVEPVLARCDAAGLPAYLESSNDRNLTFYERLGFVATGRIEVPGGPHLTPMWREPRR